MDTDTNLTAHPDAADATRQPTAPRRGQPKTSYEGNAEVQRWLQDQAIPDAAKPAFAPTFLAHQRDRLWVLSSLTHFYEDDLITDVIGLAKTGKEANVYCCVAHPRLGVDLLAAKIYRPRMFRSLSNDAIYRQSRAHRDESGNAVRNPRRQRGGERGRRDQVTAWLAAEYDVQRRLAEAGVTVPQPRAQIGNALLMDYLGDQDDPAPRLREVELDPTDAPELFAGVMRDIALMLANHCVHGDLSAFNLLYWEGTITLIDFAQAVDPRYNPDVYALFERDIARVCQYFARYGVRADPQALAAELWAKHAWG